MLVARCCNLRQQQIMQSVWGFPCPCYNWHVIGLFKPCNTQLKSFCFGPCCMKMRMGNQICLCIVKSGKAKPGYRIKCLSIGLGQSVGPI